LHCRALGTRYLMVRFMERFSPPARAVHRNPHGMGMEDGSATLPSRQFVEKAEKLCLRVAQYTVDKVSAGEAWGLRLLVVVYGVF